MKRGQFSLRLDNRSRLAAAAAMAGVPEAEIVRRGIDLAVDQLLDQDDERRPLGDRGAAVKPRVEDAENASPT